jgi:cysteinyl-tRNA synthetase
MALRIYNSLTRSKDEFVPLTPPEVLFYSCGPTVYGEFHIGNARSFVVADMIRRWLIASGYKVKYAQNITDVDDKIIDRAAREGVEPGEIARRYTDYFFDRIGRLGILKADFYPRATQHIGPMIALVRKLVERGHAYPTNDGSVWFEVATFPEYGKLSRMPLDQMRQGERVDENQQRLKRSPLDFALWKGVPPGSHSWKSPWGNGRPGWHLECSCMAMGVLGRPTIDIHSGGADLRFPHHENEIAQSECATGQPFARYWVHNGMLDIDGEKMSKSLGNIRTIDDILEHYDALTVRYFLLSARYRDKLDFTEANLHQCASATDRLVTAQRLARRAGAQPAPWQGDAELDALWADFRDGMDDDFNTPEALSAIARTVTLLNTRRMAGDMAATGRALALLDHLRDIMGFTAALERPDQELTAGQMEALTALAAEVAAEVPPGADAATLMAALIARRAAARKERDFATADALRQRIAQLGITLEDTPQGTIWRRG